MPISCMIFSAVLSAIATSSSARRAMATCLCPQPLAVRENTSATFSHSSGLVGLGGCERAR